MSTLSQSLSGIKYYMGWYGDCSQDPNSTTGSCAPFEIKDEAKIKLVWEMSDGIKSFSSENPNYSPIQQMEAGKCYMIAVEAGDGSFDIPHFVTSGNGGYVSASCPIGNYFVTTEAYTLPYTTPVVDTGYGYYPVQYSPGDTVTLTANTREGYQFQGWTALEPFSLWSEVTNVNSPTISFTMPSEPVTVKLDYLDLTRDTDGDGIPDHEDPYPNQSTQIIDWVDTDLSLLTIGDTAELKATAETDITYTISDSSVATISGNILTVIADGTAVVTATAVASAQWFEASATTSFQTDADSDSDGIPDSQDDDPYQQSQTIVWDDDLSDLNVGDTFTLTASAQTAVTYASSDTSIATISGNTLSLVAEGSVTITATSESSSDYFTATSVVNAFITTQVSSYSITSSQALNSTALTFSANGSNVTSAVAGDTVTITLSLLSGYENLQLSDITVLTGASSSSPIEVDSTITSNSNVGATATFIMPNKDVDVSWIGSVSPTGSGSGGSGSYGPNSDTAGELIVRYDASTYHNNAINSNLTEWSHYEGVVDYRPKLYDENGVQYQEESSIVTSAGAYVVNYGTLPKDGWNTVRFVFEHPDVQMNSWRPISLAPNLNISASDGSYTSDGQVYQGSEVEQMEADRYSTGLGAFVLRTNKPYGSDERELTMVISGKQTIGVWRESAEDMDGDGTLDFEDPDYFDAGPYTIEVGTYTDDGGYLDGQGMQIWKYDTGIPDYVALSSGDSHQFRHGFWVSRTSAVVPTGKTFSHWVYYNNSSSEWERFYFKRSRDLAGGGPSDNSLQSSAYGDLKVAAYYVPQGGAPEIPFYTKVLDSPAQVEMPSDGSVPQSDVNGGPLFLWYPIGTYRDGLIGSGEFGFRVIDIYSTGKKGLVLTNYSADGIRFNKYGTVNLIYTDSGGNVWDTPLDAIGTYREGLIGVGPPDALSISVTVLDFNDSANVAQIHGLYGEFALYTYDGTW